MSAVTASRVNEKLTDSEFEQFFRDHHQLVYRTAYSVTRSAEDSEDVLQTIFLRFIRRELPADLKRNPKGYLYRAAFNLAIDIVRSKKRGLLTSEAERFESSSSSTDSEAMEQSEQRLYEAIAKLHPTAAQILILRYVQNHSIAEIARLLGTTRSTVAVSLFRSRTRLRKLIRALGEKS